MSRQIIFFHNIILVPSSPECTLESRSVSFARMHSVRVCCPALCRKDCHCLFKQAHPWEL